MSYFLKGVLKQLSYVALGVEVALENYIRYREYTSAAIVAVTLFMMMAVALLLQGYRCHRMSIELEARGR